MHERESMTHGLGELFGIVEAFCCFLFPLLLPPPFLAAVTTSETER